MNKEQQIEVKLKQIIQDWEGQQFEFDQCDEHCGGSNKQGSMILMERVLDEIVEKLRESQITLGNMDAKLFRTGGYSTALRNEVVSWNTKLSTVSAKIQDWSDVQRNWRSMQRVFNSRNIAQQLPDEAKRFSNIDRNYCRILTKAFDTKLVVSLCCGIENHEMMKTLELLKSELELSQKALRGYLEQRRRLFPQFFFVTDADLLDILSSDPPAVCPHLHKVFDSVADLSFDRLEKTRILAMISAPGGPQKEAVALCKPMVAAGNVEEWLNMLVTCMQVMQYAMLVQFGCNLDVACRKQSTISPAPPGKRLQMLPVLAR